MKPKKEKESTAKFEDESADKDFKKLMKRFGVKELEKKPDIPPPVVNKSPSEPIQFIDDQDWQPAKVPIHKTKYDKSPKPTPSAATKRRKKISPGFIPNAEIDLHGVTRDEAIRKTEAFVSSCRKNKYQTALIITGRGLNSGREEGILRKAVWSWLANNSNYLHITYRWAPAFLGGNGAIIVFFN